MGTIFFFRGLLWACFSLSLLSGAIVSDYYLRHEATRKAERFLHSEGFAVSSGAAVAAAGDGRITVLENLEIAGVDLGAPAPDGRTPLLAAIEGDSGRGTEFLLSRSAVRESIDRVIGADRQTPLSAALGGRNFALADQLVAVGADIDVETEPGIPIIVAAARAGDGEMLDYLLSTGADVEFRGSLPGGALQAAADRGETAIMTQLLEAGANPDALGASGYPLLIEAVREGDRSKVRLFLSHGAKIDQPALDVAGRNFTALSFAYRREDDSIFRFLLDSGASPDVDDLSTGVPLLCEAVARADSGAVALLLQKDAATSVFGGDRRTPLGLAIRQESPGLVELLLSHGADPSFAPGSSRPPLGGVKGVNRQILTNDQMPRAGYREAVRERWRKSGGHPVKEQSTAAARPVLTRCRVRLAPMKRSGHLARAVPPLARWWFVGRSLGFRPLIRFAHPFGAALRAVYVRSFVAPILSASFLATSCRPPAAPFVVLAAGRRLLPLPAKPSDAAADLPAPALRSLEAPLVRVCQAPSIRCGGSGRVPALVRLRRFVLKGCPLPPPLLTP